MSLAVDFRKAPLWAEAMGHAQEQHGEAHRLLVSSLETMRRNAGVLLGEMPTALRGFTLHDAHHVDSLWHLASKVAGPSISFTPTEAFVFGAACILHDLGLSVAAYPGGINEIESSQAWRDTVAVGLRKSLGRPPSPKEISAAPLGIKSKALDQVLREEHARRAEELGSVFWMTTDGVQRYLLESNEMRDAYGPLIGRIAASHWWSVEVVASEFAQVVNAPAGFPYEWTIDPIKIACLLRTADAICLGADRTPRLLRAVRGISGESALHWDFQQRFHNTSVDGERVRFSATAFPREEAPAWWTGYELLVQADRELREVDDLLSRTSRDRFVAKGVLGVSTPLGLADTVPTDGWSPVDLQLKVGDINSLVRRLGGAALYGNDPWIPIRELIQNARDAITARRILEDRPPDWGQIKVSLGESEKGPYLEVSDNGVGMSEFVVREYLLDFGSSLWGSDDTRHVFPGLASTEFKSVGRFGVGFFSVLMLGDRFRVATRPYEVGQDQALVLEMDAASGRRPLIRSADPDERLVDGGTRARVYLNGSIAHVFKVKSVDDLRRRVAGLAPALDVSISVEFLGSSIGAIGANDWLDVADELLIARMAGDDESVRVRSAMTVVNNDQGEPVMRACLAPHDEGVVTLGGFVARRIRHIVGVVDGRDANLARDKAEPRVTLGQFRSWLERSVASINREHLGTDTELTLSALMMSYEIHPGDLAIAEQDGSGLSLEDIRDLASQHDEVIIIEKDDLDTWAEWEDVHANKLENFDYAENVVMVNRRTITPIDSSELGVGLDHLKLIASAVAAEWGFDASEIMDEAEVHIGACDYGSIEVSLTPTLLLRMPKATTVDFDEA